MKLWKCLTCSALRVNGFIVRRIVIFNFFILGVVFPLRDPFNPVADAVECSSSLAIRGIITSGDVRACVIGTGVSVATLHEGEESDGVMVVKIKDNEVVVKKDDEFQTLVVK